MEGESKEYSPASRKNFTKLAKSLLDRVFNKIYGGTPPDLNPHEGKLRGNQIPEKYMNIPNAPPMHYDTIPIKEKPYYSKKKNNKHYQFTLGKKFIKNYRPEHRYQN